MEAKRVSAGVAKAAFRELLDRVQQGETIIIERHGKATAIVGPMKLNDCLPKENSEDKAQTEANYSVNRLDINS